MSPPQQDSCDFLMHIRNQIIINSQQRIMMEESPQLGHYLCFVVGGYTKQCLRFILGIIPSGLRESDGMPGIKPGSTKWKAGTLPTYFAHTNWVSIFLTCLFLLERNASPNISGPFNLLLPTGMR